MRSLQLIVLVSLAGLLGCAPRPELRIHVDPRLDAQIASALRQRLAAEDGPEIAAAKEEQVRAAGRLASARDDLSAARAQHADASDSDVASVFAVKIARTKANLRWCEAFYDMTSWRLAAARARLELNRAEVLSRGGAVLDMQAFRDQFATLHQQFSLSAQRVAEARADLDSKESALSDAKSRYAEARFAR